MSDDNEMRKALEKAAIEWDKESPDDQFASEVFDDGFKRAWQHQQSRIEQLEADLAEARKDQARYQHFISLYASDDVPYEFNYTVTKTDFDEEIDKLIKDKSND